MAQQKVLAIAVQKARSKSKINIDRHAKGIHLIGDGSNIVVVLVIEFEVEMFAERKICSDLKCRLVPTF